MAERDTKGSGTIQVADVNNHFTAICKIECLRIDGKPNGGTGFIGHIPNQNLLVLLTNNHVLPTAECAKEASFTFGYTDEGDNKGTMVDGDELLDTKQWWTNPRFVENLVGLDFTMIGVKEDKMKELNVHPFDLTPTVVAEDDQLVIPQHPLTRDYKQPTPLGISLGPCKKILGFLMFYDCCTFNGSSGSPVLKVVEGKLQVVAVHRGALHGTFYNLATFFSDVFSYLRFDDKKVPEVTKKDLLEFAGKVKWKPVEMFDLLTTLRPVSADWKELAFNLIKKDQATLRGMVRAIAANSFYTVANDKALSVVVEKWLGRTIKKKRTWQTLLDVAKKLGDHEMLKYLDKNGISKDEEPQMHDVNKWSRVSPCRCDWYEFASALLPKEEARAIESDLSGGGTRECLKEVLRNWMSYTVDPTWGMVVSALEQLPDATEVVEKILADFKA